MFISSHRRPKNDVSVLVSNQDSGDLLSQALNPNLKFPLDVARKRGVEDWKNFVFTNCYTDIGNRVNGIVDLILKIQIVDIGCCSSSTVLRIIMNVVGVLDAPACKKRNFFLPNSDSPNTTNLQGPYKTARFKEKGIENPIFF